jgi:inner membrane protein
MDSISQALWGALSSEAVKSKDRVLRVPAWLIGLVGGTFPDLDSFFSSTTDPLFATLMHRHFTHSILFIPLGAFCVWLFFWPWFRQSKEHYVEYYKLAFWAYGTHWILDVMTAYGTFIFWPIGNTRHALDWLSIVDPVLTLPWLIAFVCFFIWKTKRTILARGMLFYSALYMSWTGYQHSQALETIQKYAASKGHQVERMRALPSLGNSVWFRGIYQFEGQIYALGVLVHPFRGIFHLEGSSVPRITMEDFKNLSGESLRQIQIWNWFVGDWMYWSDQSMSEIGDGRYSTSVNGFNSLWVLKFNPEDPRQSLKQMPSVREAAIERSPFEGFQLLLDQSSLVPGPVSVNAGSNSSY